MVLDSLLRYGYFPKELPESFTTSKFANAVDRNAPPSAYILSENTRQIQSICAKHNLTRPGLIKRPLGIPDPIHYHQIVKLLADNWNEIEAHCQKSKNSLSTPVIDKRKKRGLVGKFLIGESYSQSAKNRAGMRYLVSADIQSCYSSIYTHSIPWALHGKTAAKNNRRQTWHKKGGLWGNDLDMAIRNSQDGQTIGIPIGPDASLVINELITSRVDVELRKKFPNFLRRIDDFEIAVASLTEAEQAISSLEEILSGYELQLNPRKTSIDELPTPINLVWLHAVRDFHLDSATKLKQARSLQRYFQVLFHAKNKFRRSHVLSYGLRRFVFEKIEKDNIPLLHHLLWQCLAAEPSSARYVLAIFEKHKLEGIKVELDMLQQCLNRLLTASLPTSSGNEIAWALWGLLLFGQKITSGNSKKLTECKDPFALILATDCSRKGLGAVDLSAFELYLDEDALSSSMWPFAYEVGVRKWILSNAKYIENNDGYSYLRTNKVRFYDPVSSVPVRRSQAKNAKPSSNLRRLMLLNLLDSDYTD